MKQFKIKFPFEKVPRGQLGIKISWAMFCFRNPGPGLFKDHIIEENLVH